MPLAYTGHLIERELFGGAKPEKNAELKDRYVKYRDAVNIAKERQPIHETEFSISLRSKIGEIMEFGIDKIKIFTAIGTPLDKYHGVDAFVETDLSQGRKVVVTLDVTQNPNKGDNYKADIVFFVPSDGIDQELDKAGYDEIVNEVAQQVVDRIKESK
ncbi:MAG: hypothetical protein Q7R92_03720 [bacterium]|nr:hypothetical protein [bacterium]